jgi:phage-related protein
MGFIDEIKHFGEQIADKFNSAKTSVSNFFTNAWHGLEKTGDDIVHGVQTAFHTVEDYGKKAVNWVGSTLTEAKDTIKGAVTTVYSDAKGLVQGVGTGAEKLIENAQNKIGGFLQGLALPLVLVGGVIFIVVLQDQRKKGL